MMSDSGARGSIDNFVQLSGMRGLMAKPFDNPVAVGVMYMIKLNHMVDDKILSLIHI